MVTKLNIYQRILAVTQEIGSFKKDGKNTQFNFAYAGIEAVINALQPVLIEHGICLIQEGESDGTIHQFQGSKGTNNISTCTVITRAINADDPDDRVTTRTPSQGYDSLDKGIFKALSGGRKYAIFGLFNLHAGDDEPDSYQGRSDGAQQSAGKNAPKASGGIQKLRLVLFPGLSEWPPKQYKDGEPTKFNIKLAVADPDKPRMAWAGKPTKAGGPIVAMASKLGFDSNKHRYSLIKALYKAFDLPEGPTSTKDMNGGQGAFICNCLEHPNIMQKSIADEPPWSKKTAKAPPPADLSDVELDPDIDLEEDPDLFVD